MEVERSRAIALPWALSDQFLSHIFVAASRACVGRPANGQGHIAVFERTGDMARNGPTTPRGKSRKGTQPTTTGKIRNVKADQTSWRRKLQQSRIKFDDEQKSTYLAELSRHGLKGRAAATAEVSRQTIIDHLENDPEFLEAHEAAIETYRDTLADEVRRRGRDGWLEPVYNKDGRVYENALDEDGLPIMRHKEENRLVYFSEYNSWSKDQRAVLDPTVVPAYIRKFSDRMLELDVKRVDPTYRDKSTVDLNASGGGVIVAPAGMTPEEWIKEQEEKNKTREDPRERAKREREEASKKVAK